MHVLITNDDGVDSPGIRSLARAVRALDHDVTIAAPSWDSSGASAALTAVEHDGRVMVEPRTIAGLDATVLGTVTTTVTEQGKGYVSVAFEQPDARTEPGTDAALLADGYATYTPLRTVCEASRETAGLGDAP